MDAINRTFAGASEDRNTPAGETSSVDDVSHHVFRHQTTLRLLLLLSRIQGSEKAPIPIGHAGGRRLRHYVERLQNGRCQRAERMRAIND